MIKERNLNELPRGWKSYYLEEIIDNLSQGWSPKCYNEPSTNINEWAVIKTTAVQPGYFLDNENKRLPENLSPRTQHELKQGDLLITRAGPRVRVGICCMVKRTRPNLMNCDKVYRMRANPKLSIPEYIELLLNSTKYSREIELMKTGISDSGLNLTQKQFLQLKIFLPSIEIQEAIVSKIEELFSELDKGIENLRTAQLQLKTYRQSVLKWAFEGKLTNENVKEGELPMGWAWKKLGDVAKKKSLKALPADYPDAKFIGMDCIEPHTLKPFFLYDFKEFKSAGNSFKINQVLYGRMRPYLNKVYRAEFDGTCSGEFIILDCCEIFIPDLLKYILHSRGFVRFANSITTGDRPRISYEEISDYDIFLAPIDEQNNIVQEIERRLSVADKMEESITQSLQQAEALRQSILKKAFEGRLL